MSPKPLYRRPKTSWTTTAFALPWPLVSSPPVPDHPECWEATIMKKQSIIAAGVLAAGIGAFGVSQVVYAQANTGGWVTLLEGKDMKNFDAVGDANWRVAEGAVQANSGKGGFL